MPQGFGHAKEERQRQEEERQRQEEERKRQEEERKRRKHEFSEERPWKKKKNGGKTSIGSTSQSLVTTINGEGGDGSTTNQSKANSRLQDHNKNCDLPIRNLNNEVGNVVVPKSKMFKGVKELIKMDLTTEEGIGNAIKFLLRSEFSSDPEVTEVALQAQGVQVFMDKAKEGQNKLRSSLVELLISSRL